MNRAALLLLLGTASAAAGWWLVDRTHAEPNARPMRRNHDASEASGGTEGGMRSLLEPEDVVVRQAPASATAGTTTGEVVVPATPTLPANPSIVGIEHLVLSPGRFTPSLETLVAWVATFPPELALTDVVRETWADDPEECARHWGVIQRTRALQDAVSLYLARQTERHELALPPTPASEEFSHVLHELAEDADVPPGDYSPDHVSLLLEEMTAEAQIGLWADGNAEESQVEYTAAHRLQAHIRLRRSHVRSVKWLDSLLSPEDD